MHDLGTFRANLDAVAARLATRGLTLPLEEFRELDQRRRSAITEAEQAKILRHVPLGRSGESADVGRAVRFLLEEDYLTGVILPVDGGAALD